MGEIADPDSLDRRELAALSALADGLAERRFIAGWDAKEDWKPLAMKRGRPPAE